MLYVDKFKAIRQFVNLNIPWNKINFTQKEKALISKYYNLLKNKGYLNTGREGYVLKNIKRSKYKVAGAPRIKNILVDVGTKLVDGKYVTNPDHKIVIRNGEINIKTGGMPFKRIVQYDIARDWDLKDFTQHIKRKLGKIKKGNIVVTGAGDIYEMGAPSMSKDDSGIDELAKNILAMGNKYHNDYSAGERESLPEDFMYNLIIYDNRETRIASLNKKPKKRRKSKRDRIRMK
jgi:hypothetical protein